tara:strand:- start:2264 stop:2500 length:237 start_codon:yes stop_codon:yes gene_type:complete
MTIAQEYHQSKRYGSYNHNNHENSIGGSNPLHKHQDYINNDVNIIPNRMDNTEKHIELRKINQRRKEGSVLISDNTFN